MSENKLSETKREYEVRRGKPPVHRRFKKGQSDTPRGPRRPKQLGQLFLLLGRRWFLSWCFAPSIAAADAA
jgi:hypothetical protein